MIVLVLVVVIFGGLMLAGLVGFGLFASSQRYQRKAEADAPRLLAQLFDGSAQVVYSQNLENLTTPTLVKGAEANGYKLVHQIPVNADGSAKTLVFEKVTPVEA